MMRENIRLAIKYAHKGDHSAQAYLSWIYYTGEGTRKSYKKSFYWMVKAALSGNNKIIDYNLSLAYANGEGVKKNYHKSFLWALRSARKGDIDAMLAVAWSFFTGIGASVNYQKAQEWYMKVLQESPDNSHALFSMGQIYYLAHDYDNAYNYFIKANNINKHSRSCYYLGRILLLNNFKNKSYKLGIYYLRFAARKGVYEAKRLLNSKKIAKMGNLCQSRKMVSVLKK